MGCEAHLTKKCLFMPTMFQWAIIGHKVSQADVVVGVLSVYKVMH